MKSWNKENNFHDKVEDFFMRVWLEVVDFYGKLDPTSFDWLMSMDDYFAWYITSEANILRFMTAKL